MLTHWGERLERETEAREEERKCAGRSWRDDSKLVQPMCSARDLASREPVSQLFHQSGCLPL